MALLLALTGSSGAPKTNSVTYVSNEEDIIFIRQSKGSASLFVKVGKNELFITEQRNSVEIV